VEVVDADVHHVQVARATTPSKFCTNCHQNKLNLTLVADRIILICSGKILKIGSAHRGDDPGSTEDDLPPLVDKSAGPRAQSLEQRAGAIVVRGGWSGARGGCRTYYDEK
jgi:hypothetical protein